mgnify:CR=1 FL=1
MSFLQKCRDDTQYSCLVGPDEELAGKMAAELMDKMTVGGGKHKDNSVRIFRLQIKNAAVFAEELKCRRPELRCSITALKLNEEQSERIARELSEGEYPSGHILLHVPVIQRHFSELIRRYEEMQER